MLLLRFLLPLLLVLLLQLPLLLLLLLLPPPPTTKTKTFARGAKVLGVGGTDARVYTAEYPQALLWLGSLPPPPLDSSISSNIQVVRYERGQRFDLHQASACMLAGSLL